MVEFSGNLTFGQLVRIFLFAILSLVSSQGAQFRTLAFSHEVKISECLMQVGEDTHSVELPRMNFSAAYAIPADRNLVFGLKDKAGNFKVIASRRIPENLEDVIVLVLKNPRKKGLPYYLHLIDFDTKKVNFGQTLVINTSKEKVDAYLGKLNIMISPGKKVLIDERKIQHQNGRYFVNFRSLINGKWRPLCKTFWNVDPNVRRLAFMFRDPTTQRLRMFCFPERKEKVEKK